MMIKQIPESAIVHMYTMRVLNEFSAVVAHL